MLKKVIREKDKEKLDMNVFKELGKDLNYKDILQVDGAFSACHINYGKSLKFNGADSKNMAQNSRKNSLTENGHIDDLEAVQYDFNGTEKDFKKQDIILLWEKYWLEYINAFNKLVAELPDSIVTVYVGRHKDKGGTKGSHGLFQFILHLHFPPVRFLLRVRQSCREYRRRTA